MRLGALHVRLDAFDLGFQEGDALLQLVDRHRVEILLGELGQRVARLAREEVFQIHSRNR